MKKELEIEMTPSELAEVFVNWGDDEQAEFIDLIGAHFKAVDWDSQMQVLCMSKRLSRNASDFIFTAANFLKARGFDWNSPKYDWMINFYPCIGLKG